MPPDRAWLRNKSDFLLKRDVKGKVAQPMKGKADPHSCVGARGLGEAVHGHGTGVRLLCLGRGQMLSLCPHHMKEGLDP